MLRGVCWLREHTHWVDLVGNAGFVGTLLVRKRVVPDLGALSVLLKTLLFRFAILAFHFVTFAFKGLQLYGLLSRNFLRLNNWAFFHLQFFYLEVFVLLHSRKAVLSTHLFRHRQRFFLGARSIRAVTEIDGVDRFTSRPCFFVIGLQVRGVDALVER